MVLDSFQGDCFEILEVEEICGEEEGFPGAGWAGPVDVQLMRGWVNAGTDSWG